MVVIIIFLLASIVAVNGACWPAGGADQLAGAIDATKSQQNCIEELAAPRACIDRQMTRLLNRLLPVCRCLSLSVVKRPSRSSVSSFFHVVTHDARRRNALSIAKVRRSSLATAMDLSIFC